MGDVEGDSSPAPIAGSHAVRSAGYPGPKRALDLAVGSLGLLAAAPIMAVIAVAMVGSGDRGPFLYRARRVGEGGQMITIFKIRTMRHRSSGSPLTSRDDPRITAIGRFLRRYKLDELPQLWNVLRGEMALVGPRPEDPVYVDFNDPLHRRVFTARPGITGVAQLSFRDEADLLAGPDFERRYRDDILPAKLKLDCAYLDHQSVRLDLRILGRTAASVLPRPRPSGA